MMMSLPMPIEAPVIGAMSIPSPMGFRSRRDEANDAARAFVRRSLQDGYLK